MNTNRASSQQGKKTIKCKLCPTTFTYLSGLSQHIKFVHDKNKNEKCSICDMAFARKGDLNHHFKYVHLSEDMNSFECSTCNFSSTRKARHLKKVNQVILLSF